MEGIPCDNCGNFVRTDQLCGNEREDITKLISRFPDYQSYVRMDDGTICDIVTEYHAIECDYPKRWAEAVGQSLHYAEMTGKKPGVILFLKDPEGEWKHLVRAARLCAKYDIKLFVEDIR